MADARRPELRAAASRVDAATAALEVARRELWPELQVGIAYGQRRDAGMTERMGSVMLGASLPVPKPAPKPKKGAKAVDAGQPLFGFATEETLRRGQFGGTPMTFIEGQDVDVPTYIRKAMRLPAG